MLFKPCNVLVTGGAGFIGANFIRHWLATFQGDSLINLDLLTYAGSLNHLHHLPQSNKYQFVQGNIADANCVEKILREYNIDTIVHFAAESHVDRSIADPGAFIHTNIVGTYTLLEVAKKIWLTEKKWDASCCRFHHISTDEVFGSLSTHEKPFTEENAFLPNSPYSASKAGSDHLVRAYHHTYHLPTTMSHCSNNYGPYQHPEKFIPTIIRSCIQQKPIPVYGDGGNIRDWIYVIDHCEAILAILSKGEIGKTYNIGGACELSNLNLVKMICAMMDELNPEAKNHEKLIQFVTDRLGHDWRYAMDISRIKNELGWSPQENFKSGLLKTIEFFMPEKVC